LHAKVNMTQYLFQYTVAGQVTTGTHEKLIQVSVYVTFIFHENHG